MINILKELHLFDNNGNLVTLINISEGVDGSSVFGLSSNIEELKVENSSTYIYKKTNIFDVRILKPSPSDVVQLKSWASNQTGVYLSGLTLNGHLLIGDIGNGVGSKKISINEQLSDVDVFAFKISAGSMIGFNGNDGNYESYVFSGENALGMSIWSDNNSDGVANGWAATGFTSTSFSNGVQSLEADTTERSFERQVFLPYPLKSYTFSLTIDSESGTYDSNRLTAIFRDSSGALISSQNENISGTGLKTISGITPLGTVSITFLLRIQASSGTVTTECSNPVASLFGKTTYTKF